MAERIWSQLEWCMLMCPDFPLTRVQGKRILVLRDEPTPLCGTLSRISGATNARIVSNDRQSARALVYEHVEPVMADWERQ